MNKGSLNGFILSYTELATKLSLKLIALEEQILLPCKHDLQDKLTPKVTKTLFDN